MTLVTPHLNSIQGSVLSRCTAWGGHARAGGIVGLKYDGNDGINITEIISCTNSVKPKANAYASISKVNCHKGDMFGNTVNVIYDL